MYYEIIKRYKFLPQNVVGRNILTMVPGRKEKTQMCGTRGKFLYAHRFASRVITLTERGSQRISITVKMHM